MLSRKKKIKRMQYTDLENEKVTSFEQGNEQFKLLFPYIKVVVRDKVGIWRERGLAVNLILWFLNKGVSLLESQSWGGIWCQSKSLGLATEQLQDETVLGKSTLLAQGKCGVAGGNPKEATKVILRTGAPLMERAGVFNLDKRTLQGHLIWMWLLNT